jgi:hypothetical protein
MKLTASDIRTALLTQSWSHSDLVGINDSCREAFKKMQNQLGSQYRVGDKVTFAKRGGEQVHGVVIGRTPKSIKVLAENKVTWKVSPSLLHHD